MEIRTHHKPSLFNFIPLSQLFVHKASTLPTVSLDSTFLHICVQDFTFNCFRHVILDEDPQFQGLFTGYLNFRNKVWFVLK